MIKLSGSVGKMGPNKKCDVAVVQAALMNAKGGPFWPGLIDGKKTTKFVEAITSFQSANRVTPANGTIQSFGPTMNRLKAALPMSMSGLGALPGTATVFVAAAGEREAEREAEDTKRKAPFPKLEAAALAGIQKAVGKSAGLCLVRSKDSVTKDGCFATELDFQGVKWLDPRSGKVMAPGREPMGVTSYVWSQIGSGTPWQKGSPQDLLFKSKRQLKSLQNLGAGPLSADDKKLLGITAPPSAPVLLACAKGCANLIRSGQIAKPAGAAEFELLLQAISAPNPQLAKQIGQTGSAAGGPSATTQLTWTNPTGQGIRQIDAWGSGAFGAPRNGGSRQHQGVDYIASANQPVLAAVNGTVYRLGFPYANDLSYRYVGIETVKGHRVREMYVDPAPNIQPGAKVKAGDVIGTYQSLQRRFPGITEHVHVDIELGGSFIDPTTLIP